MANVSEKQLSQKHLAELRDGSGLTDATIRAAGLYTETDHRKICKALGWVMSDGSWNEVLVIPYQHTDGGYLRIKPSWPRPDHRGKPIKYESPRNKSNRAYFPPNFHELLANSTTIIVTEGEKKALKVQQDTGLPCIGLGGVWAWQERRPKNEAGQSYGKRRLIPDLESLEWQGRKVIVVFDSDAAENSQVQWAEWHFAACLSGKNCSVHIARIPADGNKKVGADDFLVRHGVDYFRKILDSAHEADKPPVPGPMDLARWYAEESHEHPDGYTIRHYRDEFHVWGGTHYRSVPDAEIDVALLQWLDHRGLQATPRLASDVRKCLASEVHIGFAVEQPAYLTVGTAQPRIPIAMQNGILDLSELTGKDVTTLRPHSPLWFSCFCLPYGYDPKAECPVWYQTLTEIFDGDEERIDMLAEWFGYCLTSDTSQHGILLLEGPPRSGKGTILRTLEATIGTDSVVSPALTSLSEMFGLWPLVGKQLAICPDAHLGHGDKALGVLERLKSISGEDSVDVHRKHMRSLSSVRLRTRFAIAVNELPKFGDSAGALGPRVHILPCRNSFVGKEDRQLEAKIKAELPGIFLWAVDGLKRLLAHGSFTKPAISREIEADFARLVSPLRAFVDELCIVGPSKECTRD